VTALLFQTELFPHGGGGGNRTPIYCLPDNRSPVELHPQSMEEGGGVEPLPLLTTSFRGWRPTAESSPSIGVLNTMSDLQKWAQGLERTSAKMLTESEVQTLLNVTENSSRNHLLLLLALGTGLRVSEIAALNVDDLSPDNEVATLRPETTKGGRGGQIILPGSVRTALQKHLKWKQMQGEPTTPGSPLFCSRGGGRGGTKRGSRLSVRGIQQAFTSWQRSSEFNRHCNFHTLRHTFASRLLRETSNNNLVQLACRLTAPSCVPIYTHRTNDEWETDLALIREKVGRPET